MSVINTNYLALVSQNNLTKSQNSLGTAIERLSSGLRINSAKDDAAGQAIANRFTANINGLTQASRNANDGISVAQTTEGALNEINENLQRIRTLTVQASTGSNSGSDLDSIQAEIGERLAEINRISEQTQFNGVKVLAGDQELKVQVGAHDNETISVNLKAIDAKTLKLDQLNVSGLKAEQINSTAATAVNVKVGVAVATDAAATAKTADGLYALADGSGYAVKAGDGTFSKATYDTGSSTWTWNSSTAANNVDASDVSTAAKVTQATVAVTPTVTGTQTIHAVENSNTHDYVLKEGGKVFAVEVAADGAITKGAEIMTPTDDPLKAIDSALSNVDSLRSELGAVQNRFQSTIANLNNTVNNLSAARSRIEDADYAVEVSNMTRAQILQQAGTSVLAQANQVPQTVLSLLR
ncbi:FliC/FljB family flagellin [Alcaligenes sp. PF14]|uniref:FliC/FljB family flagellin n=1 Tax=Alcaligenes sp. PF14 TaxID=3120297 RepID=UPI00301ACF49